MAGKLQKEDFKTEAEIIAAGGAKSQLLNDTQIYVTANTINKTLDDVIIDGDLLTATGAAVVTNKDIDGGTASNSSRVTLSKNTTANLSALTRKTGTVFYDTTLAAVVFDNGTTLTALGTSTPTDLRGTQYDISSQWSGSPSLSSVVGSKGVPYKTKDGAYRLTFNATFTISATSSVTLTLSGVTFKTGYKQAVVFSFDSYSGGPPAANQSFTNSGAGTIIITASSTFTGFEVSGDVELDSFPSWATNYYP